jgi:hypothetical protein
VFDINALAKEIAQSARDIAQRNRSVVLTTLTVIGAAALVMEAPAITVAVGGLAAVAWFTTTAAGAGIGLALDAGSSAILDGQASVDDFKATGQFVFEAYLEQAVSYVRSKSLTAALGDTWGAVTEAAISVAQTTSSFMQNDRVSSGWLASWFRKDASHALGEEWRLHLLETLGRRMAYRGRTT